MTSRIPVAGQTRTGRRNATKARDRSTSSPNTGYGDLTAPRPRGRRTEARRLGRAVGPTAVRALGPRDDAAGRRPRYGNRDVVPWLTTKTLALAGGLYLREEKTDVRDLAWSLTGADGGADASEAEVRRLAEYLESVEIDQHAVETVREHVRETRLAEFVDPDDVRSKRERMNGLRGIAKDL